MRVSFFTLGCKLNQAETDELKTTLKERGFQIVAWGQVADTAIVRACGVTIGASQTTREIIRAAKRQGSYVIATGCLENSDLPEINFGAATNEEIIKHLASLEKNTTKNNSDHPPISERTRAFIKIQNGCNFNCAYCIIPAFRGRSTSIPPKKIIEKIKIAEKNRYNEAVLTGVNICLYEQDQLKLADLLRRILKETKISRIRLGSLDPRLISQDLIKIYDDPRLLPHMHLSLQSGSNKILRSMRRGYTAQNYYAIVKKLRARHPLFSFTTDIIVGFPGESEKDFDDSCNFVKKCKFTKVHVFPFSPRPKTPAAQMTPIVADKIKTARVKKLIKIANLSGQKFSQQFIGQIKPVLFEGKRGKIRYGYTPEYLRVKCESNRDLYNQIIDTKISKNNLAN